MLNSAHEGYQYQDFLCVYFLLDQVIKEKHSIMTIDAKQYKEDKFDDLTIIDSNWCFKKQIKYSNLFNNHELSKSDLSADGTYGLPIDELFKAWQSFPNHSNVELRLCLAWDNPTDKLIDVLEEIFDKDYSFGEKQTTIFQININKLWPIDSAPLDSWKRFKESTKTIDRNEFAKFCKCLVIETKFPKFSMNIDKPFTLENILLNQADKIGIGVYPNNHINKEDFILKVAHLITRARSKSETIEVENILKRLGVNTNYGAVEQSFPIDHNKKISLITEVSGIYQQVTDKKRVLITGEPGSGKSWLISDILENSNNNGISIIKHYCYTNLDDADYLNRIRTDTFYGNLMADILCCFPELKEAKETMFASSLGEINSLIAKINSPTIILIDGLDHIDRIFEQSKSLSLDQINIIEQILKLTFNANVSILVFSQPVATIIQKLNEFEHIQMSAWQKNEINAYLSKIKLENIFFDEIPLSNLLLTKSNGNPLYLNYIVEEIKKLPNDKIVQGINELPPYDGNIEKYYNFLLRKLEQETITPQILSLVNFNLSCSDLKEITGQGKNVERSLNKLSPILKHNVSDDGYVIYHESFRRFMHEFFIDQEVNVNMVYQEVFIWFEEKGVFEYQKAYRNYLALAYNSGNTHKVSKLTNQDFIYQSIYFGNNWEEIIKNYNIIRNSICSFSEIAIVSEMKKVLSSLEHQYNEIFIKYIELVGLIFGYSKVNYLLIHEGKATLPFRSGLEVCYLCYQHGDDAPWHDYIELLISEDNLIIDDIRHVVRYYLIYNKLFELNNLVNIYYSEGNNKALELVFEELNNFQDKKYTKGLISNHPILMQLNKTKDYSLNLDLINLAHQILSFENVYDKEKIVLEQFFTQLKVQISDTKLVSKVIELFKIRNWFFNWIIFVIKIFQIKHFTAQTSDDKLIEAFNYLINEPKIVLKPRLMDIYHINDMIFSTITEGLGLCQKKNTYDGILDVLFTINNFAFNTSGLFNLICVIDNPSFIQTILLRLETLFIIQQKEEIYHEELTEYAFTLSKYFAIAKNLNKAKQFYELGIKYLLGYTCSKDISAEDLFDSFDTVYKSNNTLGLEYISKLKFVADGIDQYTSGKGTRHFQIIWFNSFFDTNQLNGGLFLLYQLMNSRYDYRLEECLNYSIKLLGNEIPSLIRCLIYQTCILDTEEENILGHIKAAYEVISDIPLTLNQSLISVKCQIERDDDFSTEFKHDALQIVSQQELPDYIKPNIKPKYQNEYRHSSVIKISEIISSLHNSFEVRKSFMAMNINEIIQYVNANKLNAINIQSLMYFFDVLLDHDNQLTDELKIFIIRLLGARERYFGDRNKEYHLFDEVFVKHQEVYEYYLVAKFVFSKDGWLHCLVDHDSFYQAYLINPKNAVKNLYELVPYDLALDNYNRSITSNLIITFSKIGLESEINNVYNASFDYIMSKFPLLPSISLCNQISNDLEMNIEEVFTCIFLSRFRLCTTLRVQLVFSGVLTLLNKSPESMIKPIKWFILNRDNYESSIFVTVLQILYEYCLEHLEYRFQFEGALKKIYPTNYFMIDYIIEDLFNIEKVKLLFIEKNIIYTPISNAEAEYVEDMWNSFHPRYHLINYNGFDMYYIMSKLKMADKWRNGLKSDYFYNNLHKISSNHIIISDLLLELVNTELYDDFKIRCDQNIIYQSMKIDTKILIAQTNSLNQRPSDLPYNDGKHQPISFFAENKNWVRLGHFEVLADTNKSTNDDNKITQKKYYGGIIFHEDSFINIFPFAKTIKAAQIFTGFNGEYPLENAIIFTDISLNQSQLEAIRILWLNPSIVSLLDLNVCTSDKGIFATNGDGDVILKYNCWSSNYYAFYRDGSMNYEIPQYLGAELIIEERYFQKICDMYKVDPTYYIVKL